MPYLISAVLFALLLLWSINTARTGNSTPLCCLTPTLPFFLLVPFLLDPKRRGKTRFPRHHCQRCGYDLTGNASGRCPECGAYVGVTRETLRELRDKSSKPGPSDSDP